MSLIVLSGTAFVITAPNGLGLSLE